jgi:hypothetical protein
VDVLDLRQLNRATLARQGLLERVDVDVPTMVRRTGGLQAQLPAPPVIGLWSRLVDFDRDAYLDAVRSGLLVRGTTLRGTLHVHEVDDYRALRMSVQPVLDTYVRGLAGRVRPEDLELAIEAGRAAFEDGPRTVAQLKSDLGERFPQSVPQGLMGAARHALQLLVVPDADDAADGWKPNAPFALARSIVGDTLAPIDDERLARRFFECLGPGSAKDLQVWCGRRGMRPVVERMLAAGELVELSTWEGDVLLDLPDAARPGPDVAAPPRFLPMWDNVLLSHADRTRVIDPAFRPYLASRNGMTPPTYLLDGFVHGTWSVERAGGSATLVLSPFAAIPTRHEAALLAEARALVAFLHPDVDDVDVRVG